MYPNQFPPDPPPPAVDPTLLAALVLAVAALTVAAFCLGRWTASRRRIDGSERLKAVRKQIDEALGKAQTATGEDVFPKARALAEAVRTSLGGVAAFGGPLEARWSGLCKALDGDAGAGHDDPGGHGHDHAEHAPGAAAEATGPISVSAGTVIIANATSSGGGGHGPTPAPSHRDKVSEAVRAFAEWWKAPGNPEEMKAAQADLLPK